MSETRLNDTALRIVVTPSQSSYFAGETLSVTIAITNTRSLQAQVVPPRSTHTHKRSAHSVSSARLARPPTSPGLPKSPSNAVGPRPYPPKPSPPTRKCLIGTTSPDHESRGEGVLARRVAAKSLSVDIPSHELAKTLPDDTKMSPLRAVRRAGESPPRRASSPLARTYSTPVPPNHPHARKASITDGPVSIPQSASASSFALTLDPIAESMSSPIPPTPPFPSPASTPAPFISVHPTGNPRLASHARSGAPHPQALLGNGHPPSRNPKPLPGDNTELVLYAYVHLTGSLFLLPQPSLARVPALAALQRHKRGPRGGGSMDIGVASPPHSRGHERRNSSIAGSLWGLISSPASAVLSPGHRARAPSYGSSPIFPATHSFASAGAKVTNHGTEGVGLGLGLGGAGLGLGGVQEGEGWDPEQSLSVFEVPPAMLAVDLSLGPGEERSYTYTVKLPSNLPPTYRGRTLRFSYQLSVGACRATAGAGAGAPGSQSRVMKVPIRIYNHVSASQPPRWYDLLTGSAEYGGRLEGKIEEGPRDLSKSSRTSTPPPPPPLPQKRGTSQGSINDLRTYALLLLEPDSVALSSSSAALPSSARVAAAMEDQELELHGSSAGGGLTGCREAVEVLTRVPKKVSYDVNKDGVKVAVLTFMKSAWRLGETVLGVVEMNDREGRARILKLSSMLEAHESLPSDLTASPTTITDKRPSTTTTTTNTTASSSTRRTHAEHHASFMSQTLRTTFALDIPSDATPSFRLSLGGKPSPSPSPSASASSSEGGGLAWKVRLCLLVAVAAPDAEVRGMVREGPRGHWGSTWVPTDSLAPLERERKPKPKPNPPAASSPSSPLPLPTSPTQTRSWASLFASTFLGMSEGGDDDDDDDHGGGGVHGGGEVLTEEDADGDDGGIDGLGAGEEEWREIAVETVECEVPVMVWPGNTAFRPEDVVFDV